MEVKYFFHQLDGMQAIGLYYEGFPKENLEVDGRKIKVFPVYFLTKWGKRSTGYYAVFDINKIKKSSEVVLTVLESQKGLFIGKGGWQVKEWIYLLGVRKIIV